MNVPQSAGMITGTSGHVLPIGMKLGHLNEERGGGGGVKEERRWRDGREKRKGRERGRGRGREGGREGGKGVLPFQSCAGALESPLAAAQWMQKVSYPYWVHEHVCTCVRKYMYIVHVHEFVCIRCVCACVSSYCIYNK